MNKENNPDFKIILEYIKDLSIETPSATALLYVRENIVMIYIYTCVYV